MVFSKIGIEGIPGLQRRERLRLGQLGASTWRVQSLKAGTADVALAIGAEKMNIPDKAKAMAIFEAGWDVVARRGELPRRW